MSWTASKQQARYIALKAARRCVRCGGGLLPEWINVSCPPCAERDSAAKAARPVTEAVRERRNAAQRRRYHAGNDRAQQRLRRHAKKERGECTRCASPAAPDSNYCPTHRDSERTRVREQQRRRRALAKAAP